MMERLGRVRFRLHEQGLRGLMEFLCRLMPAEAITCVRVNDDYVRVSCYMTKAELELMDASIPGLEFSTSATNEDEDITEAFSSFLAEFGEENTWEDDI